MITTIIANDPVALLELFAVIFTLACVIKLSISAPETSKIKIFKTYYHPTQEIFRQGGLFDARKVITARSMRFKAF